MQSAGPSRGMTFSKYYLERVGFETYTRLRLNLKEGSNSIGRVSSKEDKDFAIESVHCSAMHCIITVCDDSVVIANKSKTVGTTINDSKMTDEIMKLEENDIIGIVRPINVSCNLAGNYNLFVYRLRKYSTDNPIIIEIDDDVTYEVSDDDEPNNDVIILDPVDEKVEHDLGIQLSREFNAEIKQELLDIEEFETYCQVVKLEPSNFFDIETTEADGGVSFDLQQEAPRATSNGSGDTLVFSPIHQQEHSTHQQKDVTPQQEDVTPQQEYQTHQQGDSNIESGASQANLIDSATPHHEPMESVRLDVVDNDEPMESLLEEIAEPVINKVVDKPKKRKSSRVIEEKSNKKGEKKVESEKIKVKAHRKAKPKSASTSQIQKSKKDTKQKLITTAKVKYTLDNRGAFLTDPTQMPGLPVSVKERRKSIFVPLVKPCPPLPSPSPAKQIDETVDKEFDEMLSKLIDENDYTSFKAKKLSFNDLRKSTTYHTDDLSDNPTAEKNESLPISIIDTTPSPVKLKKLAASDTLVHQTYTDNNDCFTPNGNGETESYKHKQAVKTSRFQINPCHEIISIVTAYDFEQFRTVQLFCSSIDTNIDPFKDTFQDYSEYRGTILPLILLELWKEIQLEYTNSEIHSFLTVSVTDKNREKRGDGLRMVFHCQVDSLQKTNLCEGHILFVRCQHNFKKYEFLAVITYIAYVRKTDDHRLAHFTMETSAVTEAIPVKTLEIRAITVISNTLNAFRSVYSLDNTPLLQVLLNPLSGQLPETFNADNIVYKGYDKLDTNQTSILNAIYKQCINLNVPNISLLDGAAGTGKSCMISNLALQLVYGEGLPKPLRILICSRSNRNIDEITKRLLHVRNRSNAQKIQLVRYGLLDQIDKTCRSVSVQYMRENEQRFVQLAKIDNLEKEKKTLELKIRALLLDDENDNTAELRLWKSKHIKVNTLIDRLTAIDPSKRNDATTILLNACDIICTTLGSIPKLQNFVPSVDVCIIDEATQCNESLTLLPFGFGMSSLVLVGDSRLPPPMVYSSVAHGKNYGKSLFSRFQKLFSGKSGSPIYRINTQHRMHPEILKWPNQYFYDNQLHPVASKSTTSFPIVPYKMISYSPVQSEIENLMLLVNVLLHQVDCKQHSIGIICTDLNLKSIIQNKLMDQNHTFVAVNSASESHISEKDVIIIWISKEQGMRHLCDFTVFNRVVTRARQSLLICGADLLSYKSRPIWRSIQEDAQERNCFQHTKNLMKVKLIRTLRKNNVQGE